MSYIGKVILLGDSAVGKTSLLAQFIDGIFQDVYKQTVGANFIIKEIDLLNFIKELDVKDTNLEDIQEKGFKLYFWDLGGQHDKLFANEYYFENSHGALVIFNLASKESFNNIDFWISKMKKLSGDIPFILVGNKIDLKEKRAVSSEELEKKAKELNVEFIETSAKLNERVHEAFTNLALMIINHVKN